MNYRSEQEPYWLNDKYWICPKHVPSVKLPVSAERCWYAECGLTRPFQPCALSGCKKLRRKSSKYCSEACRKNNARKRYRIKKTQEKKNCMNS